MRAAVPVESFQNEGARIHEAGGWRANNAQDRGLAL